MKGPVPNLVISLAITLFLGATGLFALQPTPETPTNMPKTYQVKGVVREEGTGEPVSSVVVELAVGEEDFTHHPITKSAKTSVEGRFILELAPGHFQSFKLHPPVGFYWVRQPKSDGFALTAAEPVRYKDFVVRRGIVWDFQIRGPRPAMKRTLYAAIGESFLPNSLDDSGLAHVGVPSDATALRAFAQELIPGNVIFLEWERGFRADSVKSVIRTKGNREGFSITDGAGKKASLSGVDLNEPKIDGGKLVIIIAIPEPDPKAFGELVGQVVDDKRQPVAGAHVFWEIMNQEHWWPDRRGMAVMTDQGGNYRIKPIPRQWAGKSPQLVLTATKEGFGPQSRWLYFKPPADGPQTVPLLWLGPENIVRGKVVDPNGQPVEGAWVSPGRIISKQKLFIQFTKTDSAGDFILRALPKGPAILYFQFGELWGWCEGQANPDPKALTVKLQPLQPEPKQ